jgi:uncharacterized repeat protein (TIGR04138 family)
LTIAESKPCTAFYLDGAVTGDLSKTLEGLADGSPYSPQAFYFVLQGMEFAKTHVQHEIAPDAEGVRHFDGVDISWCLHDLALLQFADKAREQLAAWGITSTDDFGAIVFLLVQAGLIRASESDRPEDFQSVFKFADEFQFGPHCAIEIAEDDAAASMSSSQEPLRTPPRFGLKALLILVTLVCLGAGWFGWRWRFAKFQEQLVAEIRDNGGAAYYNSSQSRPFGNDFHADIAAISLTDARLTADLAARMARLKRLQNIQLDACEIQPGALEHLARLPLTHLGIFRGQIHDENAFTAFRSAPLTSLGISQTRLLDQHVLQIGRIRRLETLELSPHTDDQLAHLADLQLKRLSLHGAPIQGPGLRRLAGMQTLEWLDLSQTEIDDDGLAHLPTLPGLLTLHLRGARISDAAIPILQRCPRLMHLSLDRTGVTDAALQPLGRLGTLQEVSVDETAITKGAAIELGTPRVINTKWLYEEYLQRIQPAKSIPAAE